MIDDNTKRLQEITRERLAQRNRMLKMRSSLVAEIRKSNAMDRAYMRKMEC